MTGAQAQQRPASSPAGKICLTAEQAARVVDSLRQLRPVRLEARWWNRAADTYRASADTLRLANAAQARQNRNLRLVLADERVATERAEQRGDEWKKKARRRGALNWIGAAVLGGVAYLFITH